jgi:hypothetical protein
MEKMDPNYSFKGYYGSVNRGLSVYLIDKNKVSGFGYFSISYDNAVEKIKETIIKVKS